MGKIDEARKILVELGMDTKIANGTYAPCALLALADIRPKSKWIDATRMKLGISKGIMAFLKRHNYKSYEANTRESIRKQGVHSLIEHGLVEHNPDNPNIPSNSSKNHYALTPRAIEVLRWYGTKRWKSEKDKYVKELGIEVDEVKRHRGRKRILIKFGELSLALSPGLHSELIADVVDGFVPRFTDGCEVLYISDTEDKRKYIKEDLLNHFGGSIEEKKKLPDVLLVDKKRSRMFVIEIIASGGAINHRRLAHLSELFENWKVKKVFVSVFRDKESFKKFALDIAWDTEVWIASQPQHLIHFDGSKWL